MNNSTDSVITLLDKLCSIDSYWAPSEKNETKEVNEKELADYICEYLSDFPYFTIEKQEIAPGRYNVFAYTGAAENVELLIAGHLDTVRPSLGWSVEPGTIKDDKYYNLGATDTKDGIAATLDALTQTNSLDRVGLLFYVDEEYYFKGMEKFAEAYPSLPALKYILSTCGAYAKYQDGCRGCYEFEFVIEGVSGHAANSTNGRNAIEAMQYVYSALKKYATDFKTPYTTSCNLSAISGGSLSKPLTLPTAGSTPTFPASGNKIPNVAWAKIDIRPGSSDLRLANIKEVMEQALTEWNALSSEPTEIATMTQFHEVFEYAGYSSRHHGTDNPIFEAFGNIHSSNGEHNPATSGYLDIAILADQFPETTCVLMAPDGENQHKPDEWTSVSSTIAYRDSMVQLLKQYE